MKLFRCAACEAHLLHIASLKAEIARLCPDGAVRIPLVQREADAVIGGSDEMLKADAKEFTHAELQVMEDEAREAAAVLSGDYTAEY